MIGDKIVKAFEYKCGGDCICSWLPFLIVCVFFFVNIGLLYLWNKM